MEMWAEPAVRTKERKKAVSLMEGPPGLNPQRRFSQHSPLNCSGSDKLAVSWGSHGSRIDEDRNPRESRPPIPTDERAGCDVQLMAVLRSDSIVLEPLKGEDRKAGPREHLLQTLEKEMFLFHEKIKTIPWLGTSGKQLSYIGWINKSYCRARGTIFNILR